MGKKKRERKKKGEKKKRLWAGKVLSLSLQCVPRSSVGWGADDERGWDRRSRCTARMGICVCGRGGMGTGGDGRGAGGAGHRLMH